MKAGIYVRVSTSLQEERTSPDTQEARCRLAAEQAGYEFGPALTGLEQDAGPGRNPGRTPPRPDHVLQLVAFLRRQPNRKFLSDHTDTSQQHIP